MDFQDVEKKLQINPDISFMNDDEIQVLARTSIHSHAYNEFHQNNDFELPPGAPKQLLFELNKRNISPVQLFH